MLNAINLYELKNHEFSQYFSDFVKLGNQNAEVANILGDRFSSIDILNKDIEKVLNHAKGSNLTEVIVDWDNKRDRATNGIVGLIDAYTDHYEQDITEAAKLLQNSIKKYGNRIDKANLQEQTSITTQWVNDWKKDPNLSDSVELLTLTNWVGKLETYNNELNRVYLARVKQESELPDKKVADLRKEMVSIYRQLMKHVEAHAVISAHQDFTSFIEQVNVLVEKYNMLGKYQKKAGE